MSQTLTSLNYHVIFSTKHRRPIITADISESLHPVIGGLLRPRRCRLLAAGGIEDHIHLLISLVQTMAGDLWDRRWRGLSRGEPRGPADHEAQLG